MRQGVVQPTPTYPPPDVNTQEQRVQPAAQAPPQNEGPPPNAPSGPRGYRGDLRGARGYSRSGSRGHSRSNSRGHSRNNSRGDIHGGFQSHPRGGFEGNPPGEFRGNYRGDSQGFNRGGPRGEFRGVGPRGGPRGGYRGYSGPAGQQQSSLRTSPQDVRFGPPSRPNVTDESQFPALTSPGDHSRVFRGPTTLQGRGYGPGNVRRETAFVQPGRAPDDLADVVSALVVEGEAKQGGPPEI